MDHAHLRLSLHLWLCLLPSFAWAQDDAVRFQARPALIRIAVDDLPGLLAALPGTQLSRLFAEPEVHAALATATSNYKGKIGRWSRALEALEKLDPKAVAWGDLIDRDIYALDWRDLHSGELIASHSEASRHIVQTTVLVEPLPAAESRLAVTFATMADRAWRALTDGTEVTIEQKIDGFPARVIPTMQQRQHGRGAWFLHLPGQFAGGTGDPALVGACAPKVPRPPGITVAIDVVGYFALLRGLRGETDSFAKALAGLGIDRCGPLTWHIEPRGELVHEDLLLDYDERPKGVLGALLDGMAPLVDQPLPEHGLLQVRCGFDVPALVKATNELLALAEMQTLGELGLEEDLNKAWTGGMAIAVARPAAGGVVPRVYASFGIVDEVALGRLLARLAAEPWLETKDVTYEGQTCVQLRPKGAPPALQPAYNIHDGTIHFAESGLSLRALLKARAAGAPPALDTGKAPRPEGKGAVSPNFDLRFDGAAIHAAIHELWLPLWSTVTADDLSDAFEPLLQLSEMPDLESVTPHLQRGRGVLRRLPNRVVLGMSSTMGGPDLHALLATIGPTLSASMTGSWSWRTESLVHQIVTFKLGQVHAAIAAFTQRTGKRPASLAELMASPDLKDPSVLLVEDDNLAEAVVQDGKELGKTSFRYYPDGLEVTPVGETVRARLIAIKPSRWQRLAMDADGTLHEGYGDFAAKTLDQLEGKK